MKNVKTTTLVYFIKYKNCFTFTDYVKRENEVGRFRILIPTKVITLLNDIENILTLHLSGNPQKDMYMWAGMVARNGDLSGFIQDLEETHSRSLLFGDEHQIRFWETEFLKSGIYVPRYDAGPRASLSEKICYLTDKEIIPISEEVTCLA